MSTISSAHAPASGIAVQSWTSRARAAVGRWWTAYITRRIERAAIVQLSSMSDRELKDIGVSRTDIMRAARLGSGMHTFRRYQ